MLFANISNIYGYNNPYLMYRGIGISEFHIDHNIGPLNFLEKTDKDVKIIFSEIKYNILHNKYPESNIYLVTNNFDYYLGKRNLGYVRYLPLFSNLVYTKKTYKTKINNDNIELSAQVFLRLGDVSQLDPNKFIEIKEKFGDIYLKLGHFQKSLRDIVLNIKVTSNPADIKYDLDVNNSYKKELMLLSPTNDFTCYALPFHNDLDESEFYWFKEDNVLHNLVLQTLDYFDLDKNDIDDTANTYYKYVIRNDNNFVNKVHNNIRECFSVLKNIEDDLFINMNSFDEVLSYLKS